MVIMSDSSCSPAYITTNHITVGTLAGMDQPDSQDINQSENEPVENTMEMSPEHSKPLTTCIHGNQFEELESPGIHSNQTEELESPDLYGNLQQEDIESPSNRSSQSKEIKSPDLCYDQVEDFESPGVHGNLFENIQSRRIHGDLTPKNYSIHGDQAEDSESPIVHETVRNRMAASACVHGNNHMTKRVSKIYRTSKPVVMNSTLTKSKRGKTNVHGH